jgi:16S rRNA (cytidine1402-2'-O)-methyltransferase
MSGILYLVATPIGNLKDLSPRALEVLHSVEVIFAEDTRVFGRLARAFDIKTPFKSYHDHNEKALAPVIVGRVKDGADIAIVSDAGTPIISDPGYRVVNEARREGITVRSIPGPCAFISAIILSGFETHRFFFEGFLPLKSSKRKKRIEEILSRDFVTALHEAPHRIISTIGIFATFAPERELFLARELTKVYEEHISGTAAEVLAYLNSKKALGEYTVVVRGKEEE